MTLTKKQWQVVAPLFAEDDRTGNAGRRPLPARDVFNGVLWILMTGARWKDLPRADGHNERRLVQCERGLNR